MRKTLSKIPILWFVYRIIKKLLGVENYINPALFTFNQRGLMTNKNCDFIQDSEFLNAYQKGINQYESFWGKKLKEGNYPYWERHNTLWAAYNAKRLTGDFVECGTATGTTAMSAVVYLDFNWLRDRKFYLFDTFQGLDERFSTEKEWKTWKDKYPDSYEFVKNSFKNYPNVVLVKGSIPETLTQVNISRVAFLHIDLNSALPEMAAIKHFWPKMVTGAIAILDDYGWPAHREQKKSWDDFAAANGVKILSLPTGQGMMIK